MGTYYFDDSSTTSRDLTICDHAFDCIHTKCKHIKPSMTSHMLGLTGNCSDRDNLLIEIIAANADKDPNLAFKIKKSKS